MGRRGKWRSGWLLMAVMAVACSGAGGLALSGDEVRLRVVMADDWAGTEPVEDVVREFEAAHPGVRVEIDGLPFSEIDDAVDTATRSGMPYDLAQWHAFAAGARGLAQPLDDAWEAALDPDAFLPGAIGDVTWGGRRWGVPLDVNAMVLMANANHLDGIELPLDSLATFAGIRTAAAALADRSDGSRLLSHGLSTWVTYGWIRANGGEVVAVDEAGVPTFLLDSPRTVEAVEFLAGTVRDGFAHAPDLGNRAVGPREQFGTGATSLIATGSWDIVAAARRALADDPDAPRAVALPMPIGPSATGPGTAMGGSSLFVPVGSTQKDLAFAFAVAMIQDGPALALAQQEGRLPARRRVYEAPFFEDPTMQVVRGQLESASPMLLIAFEEANLAFAQAIERILVRGDSVVEAMRRAQGEAERSVALAADATP